MKKIVSILLCVVMLFGVMSTYIFAEEENSANVLTDGGNANIDISGSFVAGESEKIVSVVISWVVPEFKYTASYKWVVESLTEAIDEEKSGWSTDPATITLVNKSNQRISATFSFATSVTDSGIAGKFVSKPVVDTNADSVVDKTDISVAASILDNKIELLSAAPAAGAEKGAEKSSSVYFYITEGKLDKSHSGKIGNITIVIAALGN